jgi:intermediate cleaving peptidase 55
LTFRAGDLVLLDAGAYINHYAADISRTFPVSGHFNEQQRQLYSILLEVQEEIIHHCRMGSQETLESLYGKSLLLIQKRICQDLFRMNRSTAQYMTRRLYPHHIGHYLGMDVHDCADASSGQVLLKGKNVSWSKGELVPGLCLTVEPGIYIPPRASYGPVSDRDFDNVPEEYRGISIRIEDDIVIRDGGMDPEVLTRFTPKSVHDLEELMNSSISHI